MDPASLNLNQAKMTGDFCAALRRGRVLRKLLKFQYVVRALSQAYGIEGSMDIMDKPDGLPTSPQGDRPPLRTGSTTETKYDKQDSGSMIRQRNTP